MTKGSTAMSPRRRPSKRVRSTPSELATHGLCTWMSSVGNRVEVAAVGEHNSPSPPTPIPRHQFQIHELTRDICWDSALPSLVRDCPWPDDDSHAEEEPFEQIPVTPTRRTMKFAKVGITLQMSINQFTLAI